MLSGSSKIFPTTDWSLIARSISTGGGHACNAEVGELAAVYAPAVRRYLLIVKRLRPQEADDVVQDFLLDKLLSRRLLVHARQDRGRFRNLLVSALENYLASRKRKQLVRGAIDAGISLDAAERGEAECGVDADPASAFERHWAESVVTESLARTCRYFEETGQVRIWRVFERRILAPLTEGVPPAGYPELVREFGFATPLQAANALTTAKRAVDRALREVLGRSAAPGSTVEDELKDFLAIFGVAQKGRGTTRRNGKRSARHDGMAEG